MKHSQIKKQCEHCNKSFNVTYSRRDIARFCCHECYALSIKGVSPSGETRKKISEALKGRPPMGKPFQKGHMGYWLNKKRGEMDIDWKKKIGKANSGEKSSLWRGGKMKEYKTTDRLRRTFDYRLWRKAVFERDNWTCVLCKKRGGELQADHIKPFAYFPELRFKLENGRTLCVSCHRSTDTYGSKCYAQRT